MNELKIFAGQSNEPLAKDIAYWIDTNCSTKFTSLGKLDDRRKFADGELYVRFAESIRGADVFIVQSTNQPDSNLDQLDFMISAAKHASAGRITAVIPYFGYARQDKKDKSRVAIPIISIAKRLEAAGAHRAILLDVHSNATEIALQARDIQVDHLWARPTFVKYLKDNEKTWRSSRDLVIAAPDAHAVNLAKKYAKNLKARSFVMIHKDRPEPGKAEIIAIIGEVKGCDVIIVDDMIDSGGTTINAADALKERGAENIFAIGAHGVLSGKAAERIRYSVIERAFVTDSIFHPNIDYFASKITKISVAGLLGEAICQTHKNGSVSSLFENE